MSQTKIYIASPLGFSEVGRYFMYNRLIPAVQQLGYTVLDPWQLTDDSLTNAAAQMPYGQEKKNVWKQLNKTIGENNTKALDECNGVLAVLDGVDIDSGTASEIGYATALDKPTLGYRGDFRLSADNEGSTVNLQVEYFIKKHGGTIVTSLDEIIEQLPTVIPQIQ